MIVWKSCRFPLDAAMGAGCLPPTFAHRCGAGVVSENPQHLCCFWLTCDILDMHLGATPVTFSSFSFFFFLSSSCITPHSVQYLSSNGVHARGWTTADNRRVPAVDCIVFLL